MSKLIPNDFNTNLRQILIASDIDGTMIAKGNTFSEKMTANILKLVENGANFSIATGRSLSSVKNLLHKLGVKKCYAVCSNGAIVVQFNDLSKNDYEIIMQKNLSPKQALRKIYEKLPEAYYCIENVGKGFYVNKKMPEEIIDDEQIIKTIQELEEISAPKIIVTTLEQDNSQMRQILSEINLENVEYAFGKTAWIDITNKNISKQTGLEFLCEYLKIDRKNAIVIGDGENDITMFKWAGHSVAMGNAEENLKEIAGSITKTVQEDGCALLFQEILERNTEISMKNDKTKK